VLVGAPGPGLPRRTIRFVLFNAEEQGLVGSGAYARNQAALGTPIVAVFQMDMIGFDVLPDRTFELHAGFTPPPRSRPSRSPSPRPSPSFVPR
jgi:leucyl aminopeptidase